MQIGQIRNTYNIINHATKHHLIKIKPYNIIIKIDILSFLNSFQRDEATDDVHGRIGILAQTQIQK